jgi:hypothetical protein
MLSLIEGVASLLSRDRAPSFMTEPSELTASVDGARRSEGHERIAVRWLPVEALRPDRRNARVHVPRQVARIADSIAAFGFNVPVLVAGSLRATGGCLWPCASSSRKFP